MPAPYTGRCLCGGINFTVKSEPLAVLSCFCEHCSKGAGGPNQVIAKFTRGNVDITSGHDMISEFTLGDTSSGAPKQKAFCGTCGVTLWTIPESAKDTHLLIRTSVLTSGLDFKPKAEIFVKNRPEWMEALREATQWPGARGG